MDESAAALEWREPPADLSLGEDEVHVWRAGLDWPAVQLESFRATLAPDEQARADRFHFARHRDHFVAARGLLRAILARYLAQRPDRISFRYNPYGKPSLAESEEHATLRFNASHSHALALYAVARTREVGVDVEHVRADFAPLDIAGRFFSTREVQVLAALRPERQVEAFFNCWSRKEAYIKALGKGLSHPLHEFDVTLRPGEPASLLDDRTDGGALARWSMRELFPGDDYKGAVVYEGRGCRLSCWQWREPGLSPL